MRQKDSGKNTKMRFKDITESSLFEDLRDPDFAARYLEEVLKDGSMQAFLVAIRNVAQASGGMRRVSKQAKVGRESLYKTLSENGNPQFSTLQLILGGLGLRFSITPDEKK